MTTSSPSPRLPLEILLCIIEETARSSRHTLHNLALLSHCTLPSCRSHLFHQLTLGRIEGRPSYEELRRIRSLQDFFNREPCVADYVHHLVLNKPDLAGPASCTYATLLSNLQHVRKFLFIPRTWTAIPDHLKSSILTIIYNSSQFSVRLTRADPGPLELLASLASANLTSLRLSYGTFEACGRANNPVSSRTKISTEDSYLQSLVVEKDFSRAFVNLLTVKRANGNPILRFSHLQRCALRWSSSEDITAADKLMKIARRIEHLQLEVVCPCALEGLSQMLAHGSTHTLKSMGLVLSPPTTPGSLQELYRMSPANVLEALDIEYKVGHGVSWDEIYPVNFLDVFTRARFPRLRLIALTFHFPWKKYKGFASWREQSNLQPFKDMCAAVGIKFRYTIK